RKTGQMDELSPWCMLWARGGKWGGWTEPPTSSSSFSFRPRKPHCRLFDKVSNFRVKFGNVIMVNIYVAISLPHSQILKSELTFFEFFLGSFIAVSRSVMCN